MSSLEARDLTEAQVAFVKEYVETGDLEQAALAAGRSLATGKKWLRDARMQAAVQQEVHAKLSGGAMRALTVMQRMLEDPDIVDKVRYQVARDLLDRAGFKPEHLHQTADGRASRNVEELMDRIRELQTDLGIGNVIEAQALEVQPPDSPADNPNYIDSDENATPEEDEMLDEVQEGLIPEDDPYNIGDIM